MRPISGDVYNLLMAQGLGWQSVGADGQRNKGLGATTDGAHQQGLADAAGGATAPAYELRSGGKRSPIRLIVSNTNTRQTAHKGTASLVSVR